jgi:aryl-alcohol dehydrogenase-like predicted oxidoreductase
MRTGKVRFAGCSNFSAEQVRQFIDVSSARQLPRLEVVQSNYNLAVRDIEQSLIPLCAGEQIGIQTYSPLGAGFLTGKYSAESESLPRGSRFDLLPGHKKVYFHDDKFQLVSRLHRLAGECGMPPAQIALAFVLRNRLVDCALVGARTCRHIDQAIAALGTRFDPGWEPALFDDLNFEATSRKETQRA